jgi:hypothetical protein
VWLRVRSSDVDRPGTSKLEAEVRPESHSAQKDVVMALSP